MAVFDWLLDPGESDPSIRWQVMRDLVASPDSRLAAAVEHLRSKRTENGTWLLDKNPKGRTWLDIDGDPGLSSRWVTLRAMRVLAWAGAE